MFLSYEYLKYLGYDKETDQHSYQYKIIDTDFEEVGVVVAVGVGVGVVVAVAVAIIDCYTKRSLPIAPNLFRAIIYIRDNYDWSIDQQIEWNKKYNARWKEVEQDIKMYLLFS